MSKYIIVKDRYIWLRRLLMIKWKTGIIKTHRFLDTGNKLFLREEREIKMALNSLLTK
jgi:hypothetical protein